MRKDRLPLKCADEYDWISKNWRRILCVFKNTTGLGRKIKSRINKRARRKIKQELKSK